MAKKDIRWLHGKSVSAIGNREESITDGEKTK